MSTGAKRKIIQALDEPSEGSAATVAEPVEPRTVRLGGLWQGYVFSEQDIEDARREAWSGFGRDPS